MVPRAERVLITGGAGFVGSHLASRCLERGNIVHVLVRPDTSLERLDAMSDSIEVHQVRLGDGAALASCLAAIRPDCIFHLAARTRRRERPALADAIGSVREDLLDLVTLLVAAGSAPHAPRLFLRTGSLAEYGPGPAPHLETQREQPIDAYASALVAGTHYARMLQPRLAFHVVTARLALVYGPRQSEDFLIPSLIGRCLRGERSMVHHPSDRRDLLYVSDAVDALCRLGDRPPERGAIVNIGTGIAPSMFEVADLILHATRADPSLIDFGPDDSSGGLPDFRASTAHAREQVGWQAHVPAAVGIERTVAWWRAELGRREMALC